jgi:hypothetical protein
MGLSQINLTKREFNVAKLLVQTNVVIGPELLHLLGIRMIMKARKAVKKI